jgi:hypothetical protein
MEPLTTPRNDRNAPPGFGSFDAINPTSTPRGGFYTPDLPPPGIEPDGVGPFPPEVELAWNELQATSTNRSVLDMQKRAFMREYLEHPNTKPSKLFGLSNSNSLDKAILAQHTTRRHWTFKHFFLSNHQIYYKRDFTDEEEPMKYCICENDAFKILTRLHRNMRHAGKIFIY